MSALPAYTDDIPYADHVRDEHEADDMRALAAQERADDHDPTLFIRVNEPASPSKAIGPDDNNGSRGRVVAEVACADNFARPPAFLIPPACRCSEAHHRHRRHLGDDLHGATTAAASALPLGRGGHTFQPNPLNEALAAMTAMTVAANEHRARKAGLT